MGTGAIGGAMKNLALLASPWGGVVPLHLAAAPPDGVNTSGARGCSELCWQSLPSSLTLWISCPAAAPLAQSTRVQAHMPCRSELGNSESGQMNG